MEHFGTCPCYGQPKRERDDHLCQKCYTAGYMRLCRDGFQRWLDSLNVKVTSHHQTALEYMRSPKRWR